MKYSHKKIEKEIKYSNKRSIQKEDLKVSDSLFLLMEKLISQVSGKIQCKNPSDYTIEVFLFSSLTSIYKSLELLLTGYLDLSQATLRVALEKIAYSMYFQEFPLEEKIYRKKRKKFTNSLRFKGYSGYVDGVIDRVDKEGKIFTKINENGISWKQLIYTNLMEETHEFTHPNISYIRLSTVNNKESSISESHIIGPNRIDETVLKNSYWKIVQSLVINLVVIDTIYRDLIIENDAKTVREAIEKLNAWKKLYSEI